MALERWEAALALWRGRPFDEFDDWSPAVIERARLVELWHGALEGRVAAALHVQPDASVVALAEELVAAEPLREPRWALLFVGAGPIIGITGVAEEPAAVLVGDVTPPEVGRSRRRGGAQAAPGPQPFT